MLVLALMGAGCAAPIGVRRADPEKVQRALSANVLTSGRLSQATRNRLREVGLLDVYEREPELALATAHELLVQQYEYGEQHLSTQALVALAEASFHHAQRSGDQRYAVTAAIYAWAALFRKDANLDPLDSDTRLAADLYNRGLTFALLAGRRGDQVVARAGEVALPFGRLEIAFDESQLHWAGRTFERFLSAADLKIRGLNNRYRTQGLGAALAASPSPRPEGAQRTDLIADDVQVPVSVLLVFDDLGHDLLTGTIHAHAEIHSLSDGDHAEVAGRRVPLEFAPTAALALMIAETQPWKGEIKALFQGDLARSAEGLIALGPHEAGRIPVVLVHGTASSVTTWANMLNDLMSKSDIQRSYEFYLFSYNTGAPIAYSAWLLRQAIQQMEHVLDPEGRDPAMRRLVVIGHSQGGLLTKLTAVDSGDLFWRSISDVPFDEVKIEGESRKLVKGSLFVEPSPYVERVIFIATPHRGSYLMNYGPARLLERFVRAPANVVNAARALVAGSPEASAVARIDDVQGALGNMSPTSRFLADLVSLPVAPPIQANSIIAMSNVADPKDEASDGVVQYRSAHLDGVESEAVVESGHSCLADPMVIAEVARILRMHRETGPRSPARAAVHELTER